MAPAHDQEFKTTDGIYRSFVRACKASVAKNDSSLGPTVGQFMGSLLGLKKECNLPDPWKQYVNAFPEHALLLRRSAAEFRTAIGSKFKLELPNNAKTMTKRLTISNPDYEGGMPRMAGPTPKQGSALGKIQRKRRPRTDPSTHPNKSRKVETSREQIVLSLDDGSEYETADEMRGEDASERFCDERVPSQEMSQKLSPST
ncbi:hypothetical protein BGZ63DRAFT_401630 [Mariannaea sp. PMI_226]|nr:hypothetical protein BGZ63DRAFT_401630 [Mariannaea sp. PMI_226]